MTQAPVTPPEPWETLQEFVDDPDPQRIDEFLRGLPPGEAPRALSRLADSDQTALLNVLDPERAAELFIQMPDAQVVDLVDQLEPQTAAAIIRELPSNERADLLGDLEPEEASAIISVLPPAEAREVRTLVGYPDDVAGGLMATEYLSYPEDITVGQLIQDFHAHADRYRSYQVQYTYVVSPRGDLTGVLRLRDLLLANADAQLRDVMIHDPLTVHDTAPLDELREFFDRHHFVAVPVVGPRGQLLGVVGAEAIEEALAERADDDYRKTQGIVGGDELRTMPVLVRSRRRLAWLSVNIGLNVVAASIIALYQDTLSAVIALAVFLPIISDMSGCSGAQAVAVSMRELTVGLIRPNEMVRVWLKELSVGVLNGITLGALLAAVAVAWKGNAFLGLVVGGAMALNTLVAVSIGGTVPLLLKRMRMDPALASGPILTTVTDMCGFFLVLSFATALLPYIQEAQA